MSSPKWWGDWRPNLTPHTGNLQATDLIECTSIVGGLPVNTAITGAQIIAAASGGSGLTVGTTGITSGTIGGILFQGTGNVLQQSANLFWDNTNNRLGIGTSSPSFSLDVNGTAKVQSGIAIGGGTIDAIRLFDLQVASSSDLLHRFWNSGTGGAKMRFVSNDGTNAQHQWTSASYWLAAISVNSSIGMDFRIGLNATEAALDASTRMRIFTNGNVGIGTTTNAGYKLDVNGTARVQGNLDVSGSNILTTRYLNMNSALGLSRIEYSYSGGTLLQLGRMQGAAGLTRQFDIISKTPNYGVTSQQILTLFPSASIKYDNSAATSSTIATETASACFEVFSTNKGFLPPRMTNAQMLAIAAPAAGLVVYDTTNNKHCGYDGTAWQNFY